ncbi:23S rRNA (uracil(1939)-C(5))-methyltransferase RlmD [Thermococcus thioreducens]|uniref:23S rRNA (Uracil-5-)-methyltransferase RumA n=1 Tax=Thermococcus thioreducens TaxID=277988 RepID=A0A1I0M9I0_9EURY|nr:23S rRNA (uracil(1939)-C(5))-methyltransferase RlmD [Thermococcus thioreducens]ASJ12793.1 23S rRNA (uracil-5-)-methyltransferase RumA [Thermococcus thioreducens]SEV85155.1 23S rRNA m(5)U-1939 methyltransferase [Thermococcus thioreducens]
MIGGRIEGISDDGLGILETGGRLIYVPFSYPGDEVRVRGTKRRFGRLLAKDFELIEPSPLRERARCPRFGRCGGCLWQELKYREQLRLKAEVFERITGIEAEIKGSPKIWGFRNISNFIVTTAGIGLKEYGSPSEVVNLSECPVFSKRTAEYLRALRDFLSEMGLKPWNLKRKAGDVHYLQVREGKFTGEVMVNLIAHRKPSKDAAEAFRDYFSFADSLYWSVKRDERDDPRGNPELIGGDPFIRERIGDVTYLIHPNSFFQTNSYALELLLRAVEGFTDGEKVLDLYSGVGTFGVWLAKRGFNVEGVELNPFAVEMARKNARLNGVDAVFKVGRAEETSIGDYDTAVVDPPRKGLKETAELLVKSGVERIVYVSCNPKAFRLDYENHMAKNYRVEGAVLVDMFPHTPHVEAVVKLVRKC